MIDITHILNVLNFVSRCRMLCRWCILVVLITRIRWNVSSRAQWTKDM